MTGKSVKQKPQWRNGQSWTLIEKLDLVNAITADRRFTYAERIAAVTMITHFHNTTSNDLYPSRHQVVQRCGAKKDIVISATSKMERFGYLSFDKSDGGRNKRNTYHLKKQSEKVTFLKTVTVQKKDRGSPEKGLAGVQEKDSQVPREFILGKDGSASPSPCKGKAAASPQEASREKEVAAILKGVTASLSGRLGKHSPECQESPQANFPYPPTSAPPSSPDASRLQRSLDSWRNLRDEKEKIG